MVDILQTAFRNRVKVIPPDDHGRGNPQRRETRFLARLQQWGCLRVCSQGIRHRKGKRPPLSVSQGPDCKGNWHLRYFPGQASTQVDVQSEPEHFFFDTGELRMSHWSNPSQAFERTKRSEYGHDTGHFGGNCCYQAFALKTSGRWSMRAEAEKLGFLSGSV